jgi:hypothetical protein
MCFERNGNSMFNVTGSSNPAHGVCCSPNYFGDICNSSGNDYG